MLNDDAAHAARVRSRFKDQSAVDSAIRKALRENDPRIHEAAVARYNGANDEYMRIAREIIAEGHFSQDYVVSAISTEMNTLKEKSSSSGDKAEDFFTDKDYFNSIIAGDEASAEIVKKELIAADVAKGELPGKAEYSLESSFSSNVKNSFLDGELTESKAMDLLVEYGGETQEEAESKLVECNFELDYGYSWSERSKAYRLGAISRNELTEAIMEAESLDREEAELKVDVIDWQNEGYDYVTADRISDYTEHCESLGVPKDVYLEIRYIQSNTHNDVDANGKTINYSAMKKIMEVINSYDLTPAQKDAVARSIGWSEENIRKYKLW